MHIKDDPDEYFFTEHRWLQLQDAIADGRIQLDHVSEPAASAAGQSAKSDLTNRPPAHAGGSDLGTVGAVACDKKGHLAAATSTGGMTNKRYGRVGDTPVIGLGTYADETCAVSCTGHGEYFMLGAIAYDVGARMKYTHATLADAGRETIDRIALIGGEGGLIAVDADGNLTLPFNSEGMYRGWIDANGSPVTEIYA